MLHRYSSRRASLYEEFLKKRLTGARRYYRIAGYFQSSLLELAAEELAAIPEVRILCNTEVSPGDLQTVRMATGSRRRELEEGLLRLAWNAGRFTHLVDVNGRAAQERLAVLHHLITEGNEGERVFEIRLVPDADFGFVHGKGGVIEGDWGRTSFIGSANDTARAWTRNYELVWEDDSDEAVLWMQEEFDALWQRGFPLSDFIVKQIGRLSRRTVIEHVGPWREAPQPEPLLAEVPTVTELFGFWDHQKYFRSDQKPIYTQGNHRIPFCGLGRNGRGVKRVCVDEGVYGGLVTLWPRIQNLWLTEKAAPRFYDWQLVQSPEESWRECHVHARNLLGERGYLELLGEVLANAPEGGWRDALLFACALSQKENPLYAVEAALGALSPESWSRRLDEARSIMAERRFTLDPDDRSQLLFGATSRAPEGKRQDALKACKALLDRDGLRTVMTGLLALEPTTPDGPWHTLLRESLDLTEYRALLAEVEGERSAGVSEPAASYDVSKMTQRRLFE